jgi:hypothetical protein
MEWPFDKKVADTICDLVAEGQNLHRISKLDGFPPRWRIYEWFKENQDFADNYARAREDRADWRASKIDEVVEQMLNAQVEPQAARVAIDAHKWQAGKEKPKTYGDKQDLNIGGQDGNPLQVSLVDYALLTKK